jgi:hypothetical protein
MIFSASGELASIVRVALGGDDYGPHAIVGKKQDLSPHSKGVMMR